MGSRPTAATRTPTTMVPDTALASPVSSYGTYCEAAPSPVSSYSAYNGPVSDYAASPSTTMAPTSQPTTVPASPFSHMTGADPSPSWTVCSTPGFIGFARWPIMEDSTT